MRPRFSSLCFAILMALPTAAWAAPAIGVSPSALVFGDVDLLATATIPVTVQNSGSDPLNVGAFFFSGTSLTSFSLVSPPTLPFVLAPGATIQLSVRFSPTSLGAKSASLSIISNDPISPTKVVTLAGTGVGAEITVSPAALSFGNVNVGESDQITLNVSNTGNRSLIPSGMSISGSDAASFPQEFSPLPQLAPGSGVNIVVRFSPTSIGAKSATLIIYSNDPVTPAKVVDLSGTGQAPVLVVSDLVLDFGDLRVAAEADLQLTVTNDGSAPLIGTASISGPGASSFALTGPPGLPLLGPGQSAPIEVRFHPMSLGLKTATLTISSNDPSTPQFFVMLGGTGVAPVVSVSPESLDFGNVNLDEFSELPLLLSNAGDALGGPLTVLGLSVTGDLAFTVDGDSPPPFQLAPGAGTQLTVRFHPLSAGSKAAVVNIATDDPLTPNKVIPLTGTGLGPVIVITPDPVAFGDVQVGGTSVITMTVSNVGGSDTGLNSASIVGPDASSFTLLGPITGPLPRGQSRQFLVEFAPTSLGVKSATLEILPTPPLFPRLVALSGRGVRPEPVIAGVRDVPNDQGGRVKLSWDASTFDTQPGPVVDHYWLLRSVPPQVALAAIERGAVAGTLEEARIVESKAALYRSHSAMGTIYWELFATVPALHFIEGYSHIAPTLNDSTAASNPLTLFMVMALNAGNTSHWDSAPDSGYSVDNLAPAMPGPFTGAYRNGAAHLHWGRNAEADLAGYRIHRGASSDFVPGPQNLVSAQPDTGYVDAAAAGGYYKLSALDSHGNQSPFAVLGPAEILSVGGSNTVALAIAPPSPNPSRGETMFGFALPEAGRVSLVLYDQQGRRIRSLVGEVLPAGRHQARWDGRDEGGHLAPIGLYLVRLEAVGGARTARFTVVR